MSGFICMYNQQTDLNKQLPVFNKMLALLKDSKLNKCNIINSKFFLLGYSQFICEDFKVSKQPFRYHFNHIDYAIVLNGEIYNAKLLKEQLINEGYHFTSQSDSEVVLVSFLAYGKNCLDMLEGAFSFVIAYQGKVFAARDPLGIKPIYYYQKNDLFIISSEIKCILMYLQKCLVSKDGICQLLGLGPSVAPGKTLYKDIFALRPAHYLSIYNGFKEITRYWTLPRYNHDESYEETVDHVRQLVNHSIQQQLQGNQSIACMLSGGLDSSIITAISSQYLPKLATYSVDYQDQDKYFQPYEYQTSKDDHYIDEIKNLYHTNHQTITLSQKQLVIALKESLIARDSPGMADIDSSLLLFTREIAQNHHLVLSGECADEIFGGYPWFYREELLHLEGFPWMRDFDKRMTLFSKSVQALDIKNYVLHQYQQTLSEIDYHDTTNEDTHKRKMIYLNMAWFMQTLLTRSDSQSNHNAINLRVPFANKEIISYLYNVPWRYMYHQQIEKGLLRDAFKDLLPDDIYKRKKNPYPKTHSPIYCDLICELLKESLKDKDNILLTLFDYSKLVNLIDTGGASFKYPWFGQLMTGPQLLAYFYQIYLWGRIYHVTLELE